MKCLINNLMREISPSNETWTEHIEIWNFESRYILAVMCLVASFLLLSNSMMIVGILKTRDGKMSIPRKLFLSTSVCGIITGLVLPIVGTSGFINNGCLVEYISTAILNFSMAMDFTKLISIAVVRFLLLKYPLKNIVTDRFLYGVWLAEAVAVIAASSINLTVQDASSMSYMETYRTMVWTYGTCSSAYLVIMIFLTWKLISSFRSWQRKVHPGFTATNKGNNHKQRKAVKRLVLIAFVFVCCNVPFNVLCFVIIGFSDATYSEKPLLLSRMALLSRWVYSFNSLYCGLNSCIFMLMDKRILTLYFPKIMKPKIMLPQINP